MLVLSILLISSNCFAAADEEYTEHCLKDNIEESSSSAGCWSCGIIFSLMVNLSSAAETLYKSICAISADILIYGGAIWVAVYLLKALGSFAAQTPGKVLDGLVTFMFKWALAYAAVVSGIDAVAELIVSPLLDIGFTIGKQFAKDAAMGG